MKKLSIAAAFAACFALGSTRAQTVNGLRLSEIKTDYMQVMAIQRTFADKVLISVEYGQLAYNADDTYIKDDNGKRMEFNSAMDFINKVKSYGYELFQVFSKQNEKEDSKPVYILKRK